MAKVATTKIKGGADYAKVADRLKEFRSTFPRSKISIKVKIDSNGSATRPMIVMRSLSMGIRILLMIVVME